MLKAPQENFFSYTKGYLSLQSTAFYNVNHNNRKNYYGTHVISHSKF